MIVIYMVFCTFCAKPFWNKQSKEDYENNLKKKKYVIRHGIEKVDAMHLNMSNICK